MPRILSFALAACAVAALAVWVLTMPTSANSILAEGESRATVQAPTATQSGPAEPSERTPVQELEPAWDWASSEEDEDPLLSAEDRKLRRGRYFGGPRATLAFEFDYGWYEGEFFPPHYSLPSLKRGNSLAYSAPGGKFGHERNLWEGDTPTQHEATSEEDGLHELCLGWRRSDGEWFSRQFVDLVFDETISAAPIVFDESQRLSILIEQEAGFLELGKLDQENCKVSLYGPINADGVTDHAPINRRAELGTLLRFVGLRPGRWAVEVGPIENKVAGVRYGSNHPTTIYEFDWNGTHEFRHQIEADSSLKDVQLKLVRTYPDRSAAVPSFEYILTRLDAPHETIRNSANLPRYAPDVTLDLRLKPGRYQFAIVPGKSSRWGGAYCGAGEFEVQEDGGIYEMLVVAEARSQLFVQRLDGAPARRLTISGTVLSIGPTPLLNPVRLSQYVKYDEGIFIPSLPVGSTLLIDVSDETVAVDANRKVVLTFTDDQLRELGVDLDR